MSSKKDIIQYLYTKRSEQKPATIFALLSARSTFYKPIAIAIRLDGTLPSFLGLDIAKIPVAIRANSDPKGQTYKRIRCIPSPKSRPLPAIVAHVFRRATATRAIVSSRQWTDELVLSYSFNSVCTAFERMTRREKKRERDRSVAFGFLMMGWLE